MQEMGRPTKEERKATFTQIYKEHNAIANSDLLSKHFGSDFKYDLGKDICTYRDGKILITISDKGAIKSSNVQDPILMSQLVNRNVKSFIALEKLFDTIY